MKGLLLKDFYMMLKYCRSHIIITVAFILASLLEYNLFFIFYPCIMIGMIPVTLLAYDEQSKWNEYLGTLPYTKLQIVSEKYFIGIGSQLIAVILVTAAQAAMMLCKGTFDLSGLFALIAHLLLVSCVTSSVNLPFIFKFGVEKGRIACYIIIGVVCAGSLIFMNVVDDINAISLPFDITLPIALLAAAFVYTLSWCVSTAVYEKREI